MANIISVSCSYCDDFYPVDHTYHTSQWANPNMCPKCKILEDELQKEQFLNSLKEMPTEERLEMIENFLYDLRQK